MRLWLTTFALIGAGALLLWFGAKQFDDVWPREVRSLAGRVVDVDTRVVAGALGREQRFGFKLDKSRARFEIATALLPHPTAAALGDAARVAIEYDVKVRVRPNPAHETGGAQYEVAYYVTALSADGRVSFTSSTYRVLAALWVALALVPGALMFWMGVGRLYRLVRFGHVYRLRGRRLFSPVAGSPRFTTASAGPVRDRRKTADGQWLH